MVACDWKCLHVIFERGNIPTSNPKPIIGDWYLEKGSYLINDRVKKELCSPCILWLLSIRFAQKSVRQSTHPTSTLFFLNNRQRLSAGVRMVFVLILCVFFAPKILSSTILAMIQQPPWLLLNAAGGHIRPISIQHSRGGAGSRDPHNVLSNLSVSAQDSRGGSTTSAQRLADGHHHPSHHHPAAGLPMSQHGYVQVVAPPSQYSPVIQSGTAAARLQQHAAQHAHQTSAPVSSSRHQHHHHHHHHHSNSADVMDRKKRSAPAGTGLVNNVPSSLVWGNSDTHAKHCYW